MIDSERESPKYEPHKIGHKTISIHDNQIGSNINNFFAEHQTIYSVEKPKQNIAGNLQYGLPPSYDFHVIGRARDIMKINKLLRSRDHKPVAIIGMGGLGKTTVAVHSALAWTRKNRFKAIKNIAFLNVETVDTCMRSIQGLAREINIAVENREIGNIVKDILNYYKYKGLLIIYDNLNKDTYQYIQPYLTDNSYTYIYMLATSQMTELKAYFNCYQLEKLNEKKSIKLFEEILKEECNTENIKSEIKNLTRILDGLPLGLLQAAAFIKDIINNQNNLYSIRDYINSYYQYLRQPFPDDFRISDKRTVHVALLMNVDKIKDRIARKILMCMAYLNPANIRISIFNSLFEEDLVKRAIRELVKYSIVSRENAEQVSIHRLIQNLCQDIEESKQSKHLITVFKCIINADCVWIHSEFVLPHMDIDWINSAYKQIFTTEKFRNKLITQLNLIETDISITENWTEFHYAAFCDHREVIHTLNKKQMDWIYDDWSPLHAAALSENAVGTLIKHAPSMRNIIDTSTKSSLTALHIAAIIGNIDNVKQLVENGCNVNACDSENNTAAHLAAMHNHKYVIQLLINSGCDLSIINKDGRKVLENFFLFKRNYSVELPNEVTETVLSSLAGIAFTQKSMSRIEIEKVVITWDVLSNHEDGVLYVTNNLKMCNWWTEIQKQRVGRLVTALYNAPIALEIVTSYMVTEEISILQILDIIEADEKHPQLNLFLENCSDAQYKDIYRVICMVIDKIKEKHPQAYNLLTYAAYCPLDGIHITDLLVYTNIERKKLYSCIQLLEQYSLLEQTKNDLIRKHALVMSILRTYTQSSGDDLKIVIELLNIGLDNNKIDISYILKFMNSSDILYFSEYKNDLIQTNMINKLSNAGCNVTKIDEWNALYYAIADPRPSISLVISRLIELNVDVNISIGGITPLHLASVVGDGWIITTLISAGADIGARTREGLTPLHLAASIDNWEAVSELVRAKNRLYVSDLDINAVDSTGDTAAHCAARNGHTDILKYLKESNADMNIPNNMGETPEELLINTCLCHVS